MDTYIFNSQNYTKLKQLVEYCNTSESQLHSFQMKLGNVNIFKKLINTLDGRGYNLLWIF